MKKRLRDLITAYVRSEKKVSAVERDLEHAAETDKEAKQELLTKQRQIAIRACEEMDKCLNALPLPEEG